jgi:CBS domain-containing protein
MSIATRLRETKIRHLALRPPALVERGQSLCEAVEAIKSKGLGCVLVCDQGQLAGIFTERDLLNKVLGKSISYDSPVDEFMTPDPARLRLDDSVEAAMQLMREGDYRNIPLVDGDGKTAGVVTVRDLISCLAEHFPKEALNLPPMSDQHLARPEGA